MCTKRNNKLMELLWDIIETAPVKVVAKTTARNYSPRTLW